MNLVRCILPLLLVASNLSAKSLDDYAWVAQRSEFLAAEQALLEINEDAIRYGEEKYYFTLMGVPSTTEPWGWQLDGHHLIINFFVLGDQVVMTPVFLGSEPPRADSGRGRQRRCRCARGRGPRNPFSPSVHPG